MNAARSIDRWNHTSQLLCLIANVNKAPEAESFEPWQFHAHHAADGPPEPTDEEAEANWQILKAVFVDNPQK